TPALALLDNGLLLYFALQATGRKQIASVMTPYLDELDRLRESGAAVAGVVDRPRAASVIRLLRLAALDIEEINDDALRVAQPFERLSDRRLFEDLPPGHRTAVFVNASPTNTDYYQPRGHKIYFFYVNAAPAREAVILRVEVPQWIAEDPTLLDLAHAGIVEQSRVTQGFPYVLMRAHELAVVALRERGELDRMVMRAMMQRGLSPELSIKAQGKAWTGGSKRRFG
ncbi:MAG: DNA double-strand break repair nuclease NurA, partial [Anaerolineales bacterium]